MLDKASGYPKKRDKMNSIDPRREIGKACRFKEELKHSMWIWITISIIIELQPICATHTWTLILSGHLIHCHSFHLFKLSHKKAQQSDKSDGNDDSEASNAENESSERLIEALQL